MDLAHLFPQRALGKSGEVWGAPEMSGEVCGALDRSGEVWGAPERSGEVWGGPGSSREVRGGPGSSGLALAGWLDDWIWVWFLKNSLIILIFLIFLNEKP